MAVATEAHEVKQFIGGQWIEAADGKTFDDKDPFTGETVALVPAGGAEDAKRAIEAAAAAFEEWAATPPAMRQGIFLKAADLLEQRQDEGVSLLARGTGGPVGLGVVQKHFLAGVFPPA